MIIEQSAVYTSKWYCLQSKIMAKKMFMNRLANFLTSETPSVSTEEVPPHTQALPDSDEILPPTQTPSTSREETPLSNRNNPVSEQLPFLVLDEVSKSYPKFNTTGRSLLIKFRPQAEDRDPALYLKECITALTDYLVDEVPDRDLVGLRIRNTENVQDKLVGISLRRRDQLKPDVVWSVLGKVIQSNARFGLTDRLEVHLDHVRMPVGNGRVKTKGSSINVLSAIKRSIVTVKSVINCLVYALVIAMARINGDPKYQL